MDTLNNKELKDAGRITISDVAEALNISKTTVSRAISGKGRIGEDTRRKVLDYIEEHNYKPNPLAKGLAQSRTYNIAWVMPGDSEVTDLPFFQRCMIGVGEAAACKDYDILLVMVYDDEMSQMKRVVENHKVDGLILGRTLVHDDRIEYLKKSDLPFVAIGSTAVRGVVQIDNDHASACRELTSILIMRGMKKLALIGGDSGHMVNNIRRQGFEQGIADNGLSMADMNIYMDCKERMEVENAVAACMQNGISCIVCMDDRICSQVLDKLRRDGILIPGQIRVASFYDSTFLENNSPAVTALRYDPKELGREAGETLFRMIEGEHITGRKLLGCEVALKDSTK